MKLITICVLVLTLACGVAMAAGKPKPGELFVTQEIADNNGSVAYDPTAAIFT